MRVYVFHSSYQLTIVCVVRDIEQGVRSVEYGVRDVKFYCVFVTLFGNVQSVEGSRGAEWYLSRRQHVTLQLATFE